MSISSMLMKVQGLKSEQPQLRRELGDFLERAGVVLIDKQDQLRLAWCALLAGGHILIEDLPGMGKTTMVKLIAQLFDLPWKRIQCTSDLLPADISGGNVFDESKKSFVFHPGPIFANLVMADELNRASPKSQSAFLQAMEEGAVTVDGVTYPLPHPFIMIATQNASDSAGTNPLPESQLDRFMISISLGLPDRQGEKQLLMEPPRTTMIEGLSPILSVVQLRELRNLAAKVHVSDRVADYILDLAEWVRARAYGFSPRTALALTACSRAWAFGCNRDFVIPSDVQAVSRSVLQHRIIPKDHSYHDGLTSIIDTALQSVEVRE